MGIGNTYGHPPLGSSKHSRVPGWYFWSSIGILLVLGLICLETLSPAVSWTSQGDQVSGIAVRITYGHYSYPALRILTTYTVP